MNRKLLDNPEWLYEKYVIKKLSTIKIGKLINRSSKLVSLKLKQHNIKSRKISSAMLNVSEQIKKNNKKNWDDKSYRNKVTKSVYKAYENKNLRELTKKGSTDYWEKPDAKELASKYNKEIWTKHRKKILDGIKRSNPARIKKCREASNKNWDNKEFREKSIKALRAVCSTTKWSEDASARSMIIWQRPEYRKKMQIVAKKRWQNEEYRRKMALKRLEIPSTSYNERMLSQIFNELQIKHEKTVIGPHEFDFLLYVNPPILIEFQGEYFHPKPHDQSKLTYYHRYLSKKYRFHYIYEHEFATNGLIFNKISKILNKKIIPNKLKIKDINFKEVSREEYYNFYSKFHYIGNQGKWGYSIGGYFNNKLICCTTFSGCTRIEISKRLRIKSTEIRELSRLCMHPMYECKNLMSKLISISIKKIKESREWKYLVSYADTTQGHIGTIYKASNWIRDGETPKSYHYLKDGHIAHKKTIWDQAKKNSMKEEEYAKKYNFIKVPELPKIRYLYKLQ